MSYEVEPATYYATYDTISCIQDTAAATKDKKTVVFFYTSCIIISLIGGFTFHMAWNNKKYKEGSKVDHTRPPLDCRRGKVVVMEDPKRFARRALGWGTLLALVATGTVGLTAVYSWKM